MANDPDSFLSSSGFSSSPCLASEIAPNYFDPLAVDPRQARDVARWRKSERVRLRDVRKQLKSAERKEIATALMAGLRTVLDERLRGSNLRVVSFYWPIQDEPDLRPLMTELSETGIDIALPLVETKASPLVFRRWTPNTRMVRGDWNIPVPPPDAPIVMPELVLAPLVGWDGEGYRLGYGGGYFDRTLAALARRPFAIGIGFQSARLATIYPQPHDIALDLILSEQGVQVAREN